MAIDGHRGARKGRGFRNIALWGWGKTGSSSKQAHIWAYVGGAKRMIRNML